MRRKAPVHGTEEIVTFFAWFPITIYDDRRWLERVTIRRRWIMGQWELFYKDLEFIDEK